MIFETPPAPTVRRPLFLGQDVGFVFELGVRLGRAGLAQHLATFQPRPANN
ncbi:MAG: hypothetical protein JNK19_05250 [Tabrizicola sp.]|nr:hypothetical protein [Tabrizicola sp.]